MKLNVRRLLVLGMLSLVPAAVGCGEADGSNDSAAVGPRERCETLVSAHCNRVAECGKTIQNYFRSAADEQAYVDACESSLGSSLCTTAVDTSPTFNQCVASLPSAACVINASSKTGFSPDLDVPSVCLDSVLMSRK
ncbi:MAG TPA: hypothetical protein VFN67_40010 [Polyangiales bacterium]|nr:hypothetical protein [Polyangiales bacterium]